jgi:formamidopyrimidine-DNA glycosylase
VPELPEVETIVRDLRPVLTGRRFASARLSHDDVLRGVTRPALIRGLAGARVQEVTRRAKHAVLRLDRGTRLVVQPGMTGSLIVYRRALTREESRYGVLRLPLSDGGELVYRDMRRLGTLLLLDERAWAQYDRALGPEPLSPEFTPARLSEAFRGTRQYVKKALMDQRLVVGVGNIYANEALFAAGIDPSRAANTLPTAEVARLHREVQRILNAAIASNGTTFRDYRTGTGGRGNFQLELMVYEREGEPCRVCGTTLAGTHAIDARITVFCWRCQGRNDGMTERRKD